MERKRVLVTDLPVNVIIGLGREPYRSVNDIATQILARRYGMTYRPSGRKRRNSSLRTRRPRLILKLPEPIWAEMKKEAAPYSTVKQVAIDAFAQFYDGVE